VSTPSATRRPSRGLDVLTAILLGLVSLTTALGAWQADTWSRQADDYGESSADARDATITRGVDWQYTLRLDTGNILQARKYAVLQDQATAADDYRAAAYSETMVGNYLGRLVNNRGLAEAFESWREHGFPATESPLDQPLYLVDLRGESDSYAMVSSLAGGFKDALKAKAGTFTQAALVNALALFLLGVAGINRLRAARFATLVLGAVAYLASLVMMAGAYG
jgi:hypothetical protein